MIRSPTIQQHCRLRGHGPFPLGSISFQETVSVVCTHKKGIKLTIFRHYYVKRRQKVEAISKASDYIPALNSYKEGSLAEQMLICGLLHSSSTNSQTLTYIQVQQLPIVPAVHSDVRFI